LFATGIYKGRNTNNKPKVILLDLKMPKVNGIKVLAKIKADSKTRDIPVVVLTSSKEHPDVKKCYELGVNSYIVKPVEFSSFMKSISDLGMYWLGLNQAP
jgi:two-component system response regulator